MKEPKTLSAQRQDEPLRAGSGAWLAREMTNMNKTQIEKPRCSQLCSIAWFGVFAVMLYIAAAWITFQYRNPKANQMSFYRDFRAVITWQTLERYQ